MTILIIPPHSFILLSMIVFYEDRNQQTSSSKNRHAFEIKNQQKVHSIICGIWIITVDMEFHRIYVRQANTTFLVASKS